MSAANGSAVPADSTEAAGKGKGKDVGQSHAQDMMMDDDDSSEEESGVEEHGEPEEEDEDNMEEIDTENIVPEQTRRKQINWAEAEQKLKEEGEDMDDDDEDDEDFEDPDNGDHMED